MKLIKNLFLFILISTGITSSAQNISVHDPVAIKQGDTYYLFCTGRGIGAYSSKDLKNWEREPGVFEEKPEWTDTVVPGFRNHIWAPDISFHNNTYYIYYSVSAFGKNTSAIGVATNKTLDSNDENYKWVDHGIVVQSVPGRDLWNAIDPNLVIDENNTPWLSFGSFWNGMKMVKLNSDLISIAQPQEWYTIARRERSFDTEDTSAGSASIEAPFVFKKNGYYYLFVSWDYCCRGEDSTYKVVVGRSEKATGPYIDKDGKPLNSGGGTLFIEGNKNWNGIGHNSAYTFDGKDYYISHGYDANDEGRSKLIIKEISWSNEWPVINQMD